MSRELAREARKRFDEGYGYLPSGGTLALITALEAEIAKREELEGALNLLLDRLDPLDDWNRRMEDGRFPWDVVVEALGRNEARAEEEGK